jgi:hypothetical protein
MDRSEADNIVDPMIDDWIKEHGAGLDAGAFEPRGADTLNLQRLLFLLAHYPASYVEECKENPDNIRLLAIKKLRWERIQIVDKIVEEAKRKRRKGQSLEEAIKLAVKKFKENQRGNNRTENPKTV